VLSRQKKLAAVAIGIALASAPVAFVELYIDHQIRTEVELTAKRGIVLAETRIKRVLTGLDELGNRGISGCSTGEREALGAAMFDIMAIKELAVVDAAGETLCTNHGLNLRERQTVSRHAAPSDPNVIIEVVTLGTRRDRMVRVRRMQGNGGNGLAASIPADMLLAQASMDGNELRSHAVMVTSDGTVIGETGRKPDAHDAGDRLAATLKSRDYGMTITSMMSRRSLSASRSDVRAFGFTTGAGLFLAILGLIAFARGRRDHDPMAELRRALEADEFVPYYQPILDISNGRLEGAEVLIRWRKADGTVVPPLSFIPLLESSGLIFDVTRALMRRVCREMGAAIGRRSRFKIGFNLTARHFDDHTIVNDVSDVFAGSSIALSQVVLEVTERHPLEDLAGARSVIAALQDLGVRVAIDDVGAGHGGLSYLLKLGVDMIKIDKLFVDAIGTERHSTVIINSLVELARSMRMDIVAEGVESFEQVEHLRGLGIGLAQGYVFSPPLPGPAFLQLLDAADPLARDHDEPVPAPHYIAARNRIYAA